jgi:hypothetical protein
LQRSLDETFAAWKTAPGAPKLSVHAHVHLYALSFSNIELGILIAVDWCVVQDERLLADERIYVGRYRHNFPFPVETLGSAKNKANAALVRHIAQRTLTLAGDSTVREPVGDVFETMDDALAVFPDQLRSYYVGPLYGSISAATTIKGREPMARIDWAALLGLTKASDEHDG